MRLDGRQRDLEAARDVLGAASLGKELKDLALACAELFALR